MSINGLNNNSISYNSIDGLINLYATGIYENGNPIIVSNLVPYTGATQHVDLNNQNLINVNSLESSNIIYTGLLNSVSPTIFNYISTLTSNAQTQLNNIVSSLSNYQLLNAIVNAVGSGFDLSVSSNSNILTITKSTGASFSNDGGMLMFKQTYFPNDVSISTGGISGYQNTSGSFGGGLSFWYTPPSQSTLVRGMTLSQNGYVGIGILSPSYELHVVGYINTTQGLVLNGATTLSNTVLGYLSGVSSSIQTQLNNIVSSLSNYLTISSAASTYLTIANASSTYLTIANASSTYLTIANAASIYQTQINTINNTLSTNVALLNASNTFTGAINTFNNQSYFNQINCNTIASQTAGDLGLYGSGNTNIRFYVNGSNLFTINSSGLNNISPTVFGYLSGVSSSIQTQINTINTTISGLPTLAGSNVFTGANNFTNTAFYFAQINGNTIASNSGDLGLYGSGNTNIRFYVNGSNLFTINSSGLNNISPTVFGYLSGVSSNIQTQFNTINSTISGLPTLSANNTWTGNNKFPNLNIGNGTAQQNNLVKIENNSGKCGISLGSATTSLRYIGITNPSDGTDTGTNSMFSGIVFGGTNLGTASGNLIFYTADSATNTSEMRLVIERNGRFGFNVAIPSYTMDIVGDMRLSGNALFQSQITATQLNCNTITSTSSSNNLALYSLSPQMNFILNGASNHHTISFGAGSSSLFNCPSDFQLQLNSQNSYFASATSHTWYISATPIMNLTTSSGDMLSFSRLTNNPAINMGNNYFAYASSAGQWVTGSATGDMVLRTSTNIRFTVDSGSTEVLSCQSNNVVVTGNVKGTSAINLNLGSGSNAYGGCTSLNNTNTLFGTSLFSSGNWNQGNYFVLTNSSSTVANVAGLGLWGGSNCGIVALSPFVSWNPLSITGGSVSMYLNGTYSCGLTSSGWSPASDARVKKDIKLLKTSRSLERVLAVKPYTYKRIFKATEHGELDEKITEKPLVGFVAQQINESNPHCLDTWKDDEEERFSLCYNDYVIHLCGSVQELNKTIQEQDKVIKTLQADIATLHASLTQVINTLNSLNTNNISS